jgi:hypothetical protein
LNINEVRFDLVVCAIHVSLSLFADTHNIVSERVSSPLGTDESDTAQYKDSDRKRNDHHLSVLLDAIINSRVMIRTKSLILMNLACNS